MGGHPRRHLQASGGCTPLHITGWVPACALHYWLSAVKIKHVLEGAFRPHTCYPSARSRQPSVLMYAHHLPSKSGLRSRPLSLSLSHTRSRLADLGSTLARLGAAAFKQMQPAVALHCFQLIFVLNTTCCMLAGHGGWGGSSADLFRWASGAGVLLNCGSLVPRKLLAEASSRPELASQLLTSALEAAAQQLMALHSVLELLRDSGPDHQRTCVAWAASVASPDRLLTWLATLGLVVRLAGDTGNGLPPVLPARCTACMPAAPLSRPAHLPAHVGAACSQWTVCPCPARPPSL